VDGVESPIVLTYAEYAQQVARAVTGLRDVGVVPGSRVAMLLENGVPFHIADIAAQFCGATPISLYTAATAEQLTYVLQHSQARVLIAGSQYAEVVDDVRRRIPELVIVVVGNGIEGATRWSDIVSCEPATLNADVVTPESCATIIYTSGTTGPPKGVQLSQRNVTHNASGYLERAGVDPVGQRLVSYLPMAHIAERVVSHYSAIIGAQTVWPCPRVSELALYLRVVRPHALFGVPLIWERLQAAILGELGKRQLVGALFRRADGFAHSYVPGVRQGGKLLRRLVGRVIVKRAGLGVLRYCSSGGAALDASVIQWFRALGVPLTESYGMSESTGPMTWTPHSYRKGAAGPPLPGVTVSIAKDGEILCQGPSVFSGYLDDAQRTNEVLIDGWLHTGDLGSLDRHGFLHVAGRKKDLIVTRGGENVSPSNIETLLTAFPLISGACVVGDDRPYLVALISLDDLELQRWFRREGLNAVPLPAAAEHERLVSTIGLIVDSVNANTSRSEQLRRFKILDHHWDGDMELLTPTMKPKRRNVLARYASEIEALYD
jgi:long-chain acyl-CoA synthetase